MNPNKVVIDDVNRNGSDVILKFLGESISQTSEAPHGHSHGGVLTFDVGRIDVFRIWVAGNRMTLAGCAYSGAVPFLAFIGDTINFYQLCIVDIFAEAVRNGGEIHFQAIGSKLHAMSKTAREILNECGGASRVTLANKPRAN